MLVTTFVKISLLLDPNKKVNHSQKLSKKSVSAVFTYQSRFPTQEHLAMHQEPNAQTEQL